MEYCWPMSDEEPAAAISIVFRFSPPIALSEARRAARASTSCANAGPADSTNSATRRENLRAIYPPYLRLMTVSLSAADVRVVSWRVRRLPERLLARPHHQHVGEAEAACHLRRASSCSAMRARTSPFAAPCPS